MDISDEATKDMGTVIKVSGLDALYKSFSLGFVILSNFTSYPKLYVSLIRKHEFFFFCNRDSPFSKISSSFHQRFAKQISSAVVTSDWF